MKFMISQVLLFVIKLFLKFLLKKNSKQAMVQIVEDVAKIMKKKTPNS